MRKGEGGPQNLRFASKHVGAYCGNGDSGRSMFEEGITISIWFKKVATELGLLV